MKLFRLPYQFPAKDSSIVVEALFSCFQKDKDRIKQEMDAFNRRRKKPSLCTTCAGSIFKNPPGYCRRLIEAAGLKVLGLVMQISPYANFIINLGAATARDIMMLVEDQRVGTGTFRH